jgi:FkbM family methyltransferase
MRLPNGLELDVVSTTDVPVLYDEVFVQRCYAGHGLPALKAGDVVVDVGANIGVHAVAAARAVAPGGTVLAVEPAPEAAAALSRNLARHAPAHSVKVAVAAVALSDAEHPAATLFTYPRCAGWSTLHPDDEEARMTSPRPRTAVLCSLAPALTRRVCVPPTATQVEANTAAFATASLRQALAALGGPLRLLAPLVACLQRAAAASESTPPPAAPGLLGRVAAAVRAVAAARYVAAFRFAMRHLRRGASRVAVPLTTLSALLAKEAAAGRLAADADVALLKIDVERGELAVLRGVAPADWPRVRSVAAEVHDAGGALAAVQRLLLAPPAAFDTVTAEQTEAMRGTNLYMVYASRSAKPAAAAS